MIATYVDTAPPARRAGPSGAPGPTARIASMPDVWGIVLAGGEGVLWSDWGTPDRVVRTLLRINAAPRWLPAWEARMGDTSHV